jgi:CheY-like chemotaxis protein
MSKVICIIDDDEIYQFLIKKIIKSSKTDVAIVSFKNGKDAVDNIHNKLHVPNELPDIILLDIEMPIMDGWDFMEKMEGLFKTNPSMDTKIYIVSSSISYDDIERANSYPNVIGYYSKPITLADINVILQQA